MPCGIMILWGIPASSTYTSATSGKKSSPIRSIPSTSRPFGESGTSLRDPGKNEGAARTEQSDVSLVDRPVRSRFRPVRHVAFGKFLPGVPDEPGGQRGGFGRRGPGEEGGRNGSGCGGATGTDPRRPGVDRGTGRETAGGFGEGPGGCEPFCRTSRGAAGPAVLPGTTRLLYPGRPNPRGGSPGAGRERGGGPPDRV